MRGHQVIAPCKNLQGIWFLPTKGFDDSSSKLKVCNQRYIGIDGTTTDEITIWPTIWVILPRYVNDKVHSAVINYLHGAQPIAKALCDGKALNAKTLKHFRCTWRSRI